MRTVILAIVGLVIGILLIVNVLPDTVNEVVTDDYSENYEVTTGVGETSTTETLTYAHYYENLTELSATSTDEDDSPSILDYDEETYDVTVGGLQASESRILTVSYVIEAHQEFTGFAGFVRLLPFLAIIGLVVASLWGLFSHFSSSRG